jgi:hypothetical protein
MKAPSRKVRADVSANDGVSCSCDVHAHHSFVLSFLVTKESPHVKTYDWSFGKQTPMAVGLLVFLENQKKAGYQRRERKQRQVLYINPFPEKWHLNS